MAHVGLTPQSVNQFGGFKVQGRDAAGADRIVDDAVSLAQAAFAVVAEGVPAEVGRRITQAIEIPTIEVVSGDYPGPEHTY